MVIKENRTRSFRLTEVEGFDPITVFMEYRDPNNDVLTVSCNGRAWSAKFDKMGWSFEDYIRLFSNPLIMAFMDLCGDAEIVDYECITKRVNEHRSGDEIAISGPLDLVTFAEDVRACFGGCDSEWDLPKKENPDYEYLDRVLTKVREAFKDLRMNGVKRHG